MSRQTLSIARHRRACTICHHAERAEIEREFLSWRSPEKIARIFKLGNRSTVYRHAHCFDLFTKRRRNVRGALERIIEQVDSVEVTGATVVSAVLAMGRINQTGELVELGDQSTLARLFDRMSRPELEKYAESGELPEWFDVGGGL